MLPKIAVLSMDVEDWYHLDYFKSLPAAARETSMLDGLDTYLDVLSEEGILSSFFVVGEIARSVSSTLRAMIVAGHDIGCHGRAHVRPMSMDPESFSRDVSSARAELQDITGRPVAGFRASCFSLDRERLDILRDTGFLYDSSKIQFDAHPLYGRLDLNGFEHSRDGVLRCGDFFEFEVSTVQFLGKTFPVSGGGYLRIFPWLVMRPLIHRYLRMAETYVLYIHPFELSSQPSPVGQFAVSRRAAMRFGIGRKTVKTKLKRLISMLRAHGFGFSSFATLRTELLASSSETK